jgi:hypothetical protein
MKRGDGKCAFRFAWGASLRKSWPKLKDADIKLD